MTGTALNELLLDLYTCPLDRTRWNGVLDRIRQRLQIRSAAVQLLRRQDDETTVRWVARDSESEADRGHHNPFICGDPNPRLRCRLNLQNNADKIFMRDRDFAERGDPVALGNLKSALRDIGLGAFLSSRIGITQHDSLVLVLHRDVRDTREFSQQDEAFLASVMPHLRQTVVLSEQLSAVERRLEGLEQAIDHVPMGIALCDAEAAPTWYNNRAARTFAARDCLWISRGRLTGAVPDDTNALRRLIAGAAADEVEQVSLTERCLLLGRPATQCPLQVVVVPFRAQHHRYEARPEESFDRTRVLVFFSTPGNRTVLPTDAVANLFSLFAAESRLAVALCSGQSVTDYAANHGVAVGTARFQLKQVLAKTQACRQSELVRKICTSVVAYAMSDEWDCRNGAPGSEVSISRPPSGRPRFQPSLPRYPVESS